MVAKSNLKKNFFTLFLGTIHRRCTRARAPFLDGGERMDRLSTPLGRVANQNWLLDCIQDITSKISNQT